MTRTRREVMVTAGDCWGIWDVYGRIMDENRLWGIQRAIVQLHKLQLWVCRAFGAKVVA
jgi:hypothetical protein